MAIIMLRVRGMGLPRVILAWMGTERGVTEVRRHFRRTWREMEDQTWLPMVLSPAPTPAEKLVKIIEDVARDLWVGTSSGRQ